MFETKPIKYELNENGCHLCISHAQKPNGYCAIRIDGKRWYIHRYIYHTTYGEIPEGLVVRHKCDTPNCINPEHLELGTMADNNRDMMERKRMPSGENATVSKLTREQAIYIRESVEKTGRELARELGVSECTVSKVRLRKTWKDI